MGGFIDQHLKQSVDDLATPPAVRARAFEEIRRREDLRASFVWLIAFMAIASIALFVAQLLLTTTNGDCCGRANVGKAFASEVWVIGLLVCGTVIGFLFGIPRAKGSESASAGTTTGTTKEVVARSDPSLSVNTNLEQISDWLTKILVGVGLTQLTKAPDRIVALARYMSDSACGFSCAPLAAGTLLVFLPVGFMFGYLATRMYLSPAFLRADRGLSGRDDFLSAPIGPDPDGPGDSPAAARPSASLSVSTLIEDRTASTGSPNDIIFSTLYADAKRELAAHAYGPAVDQYRRLVNLMPNSPIVLQEFIWGLFKRGPEWSEEIAANLKHLEAIRDSGKPVSRPETYASLTFHYLYDKAPLGADSTVRLADDYIKNKKGRPAAGIFINLACAYGQKHRSSNNELEKTKFTSAALDAMKAAVKLNPSSKSRLADLLHGVDGEDDLQDFRGDAAFEAVVR